MYFIKSSMGLACETEQKLREKSSQVLLPMNAARNINTVGFVQEKTT